MSFSKAGSLPSLVDQYERSFNDVQAHISKIDDEKTLKQLKTSLMYLSTNEKKISSQLDSSTDPNIESFRGRFMMCVDGFHTYHAAWDAAIKKKEAEFKQVREEQAQKQGTASSQPQMSQEQMQIYQDAQDLEYTGRQIEEIVAMQKDINELTHQIDDKITEDHEKVIRIEDKIEDTKFHMQEGNKELDKAEKDAKKCNIF